MFETLTEKILGTLRTMSGKTRLSEEALDEICRQLRNNLLEADVNVKVVKDFIENVRKKSMTGDLQRSLTPEQHFIRIVYEELAVLMGKSVEPLNLKARPPAVMMVVGLQGSGKTTTLVKIAHYIQKHLKKSVGVASVDVYRPAAIEQLKVQAEKVQIPSFESVQVSSVRERALLALEDAIRNHHEVLLLDTAGRLHVDEALMEELGELASAMNPIETLLVVDSMIGQESVRVATSFLERVTLSGIVLTKLDGDARGGAALSIRSVTGIPIKFVGTGEKPSDLEVFHPDRIASRILDMGDLLSLAEKAKSAIEPEEGLKLAKKLKKNDFTLSDFYTHLQQIKKMGSLENLMKFIPGMGQMTKNLGSMTPPEGELKKIEAIILSMTPQERVDHDILDGSRRRRIASGSGTKVEDVNRLMKQFLEARKMMTRLAKSGMGKRRGLW